MQEKNQELYPYQTNGIDLRKLIYSLVARKLLIFGLTGFITLLAIIYALNLTPTYKAVSTFTSPSDISILNINKLELTEETRTSVYTYFLTKLSSQKFQTKVFLDGGYLTALNPENTPIDNVNQFTSGFINSVVLSSPDINLQADFLVELPYSVSMEGGNGEIISRFLNELIDKANIETVSDISSLIKQKIAIRLDEISTERGLLLDRAEQDRFSQIERIREEDAQKIREINNQIDREKFTVKENRLNQIVVLTDAAKLAKSLGIIENNFKLISDDGIDSNLTIAIGENKDLPQWYLYGEKALIERIELLESRTSDDPFTPELVTLTNQLHEIQNNNLLQTLEERQDDSPFIARINELDIEKIKLESSILDTTGIDSKQLSQVAITPTTPIKPNKKIIVLAAFIGGFMMSILLALVMEVFKPDEKNSA